MAALLEIKDLCLDYGAVRALNNVNIEVGEREIVAVLGANGAGKTSLLRAISGLRTRTSGTVLFRGEDVASIPAYALASRGIAHVPEGRRVFATLSVSENLKLGAYGVRGSRDAREAKSAESRVYELFPILAERRNQFAGTLSGGEQQMLAIGRALVSKPSLLLLDEPSLGLAPIIVQEIFAMIRRIHDEEKVSILLVEQNARKALKTASRGYILELGKVVAQGPADTLAADGKVNAAYLGSGIRSGGGPKSKTAPEPESVLESTPESESAPESAFKA
ncbi:MAG: ABC transporter ATP-binding protein [Rectinema sp.]